MGAAVRIVLLLVVGVVVGAGAVIGYLELNPRAMAAPTARWSPPPRLDLPPRDGALPASTSARGLLQNEELLQDLYERVSPSVVNITVRGRGNGANTERDADG